MNDNDREPPSWGTPEDEQGLRDAERRVCNECGEFWIDTGDTECPFCGSDDTSGGWEPSEGPP